MKSTESTRFFGPSLLIMPCARCAALPHSGSVVSISRLSQYSVSSMRGLPCVQIAPAYSPLASAGCTVLAIRASAGRGGCWPRCGGRYGKKSLPSVSGAMSPVAHVGAPCGRQALRVAGRRQHAEKIDVGVRRDQIAGAVLADAEPVDLLDRPRAVRKERLAALVGGRDVLLAVSVPGAAVGLARHVRRADRAHPPAAARPRTPACPRRLRRCL